MKQLIKQLREAVESPDDHKLILMRNNLVTLLDYIESIEKELAEADRRATLRTWEEAWKNLHDLWDRMESGEISCGVIPHMLSSIINSRIQQYGTHDV